MYMQEARVNAGLSMQDLSILTETGVCLLSKIQVGKRRPTPIEAERIAEACGVEIKDLEWGEPKGGYRRRCIKEGGKSRATTVVTTPRPEASGHANGNGHIATAEVVAAIVAVPPSLTWLLDQVVRTFGPDEATRRLLGK